MNIILFRSNNIFDSRVNKYCNYYKRAGLNYTIVGWDRKGEGLQREHYSFFRYKAGEAAGGLKAIRNHFRWMRYVYRFLRHQHDVTTIHACDLNSAFPAAVFKALHKKSVVLVFDACDWFSANFSHYKFLHALFKLMERFTCKYADELIICEPERIAQVPFKLKKKPLVMQNIPEMDRNLLTDIQDKYRFDNDNPTLAYMGGFASTRFLTELLTLAETEPFNLLIAGFGDKSIIQKCEEMNAHENVKYFGRVNMVDGLNMENAADVVYAMYCKVDPNNVYAAPNKYYEAMLLGKPLITTKGTLPGDNVVRNKTGWAVEEDIEEMRNLIRRLNKDEINEKGEKALALWESQYKYKISEFFEKTYSKVIK